MSYGWPYNYDDEGFEITPAPAPDWEGFEPCAGCGRPVARDEARRLPEGGYVCDDCPISEPHREEN